MELFAHLGERLPGLRMQRNFSFAAHTTVGCGGRAAVAASPGDEQEARALLRLLRRERIPYCVLGAGANVLPADEDFEGVVLRTNALTSLSLEGGSILAGAGVTGGSLLSFARSRERGGLSPFSGIPMTVGGGTAMNAGVRELHFSDVVEEVVCTDGEGILTLSNADCRFQEKDSVFSPSLVVLRVRLATRTARREEIDHESCYFRMRRAHLPKGRSMGCTFVNPPEATAGRLIEQCGLKGRRVGGAVVSREHANFLLNEGGTSRDLADLIVLVKREVANATGIVLREEIRYIP